MNNTLIREVSFNNGLKEKIAIIGNGDFKMKGNYVLANRDEVLSNVSSKIKKSFLMQDVGLSSTFFGLTITCALLLVVISGIIMYFSWKL